MEKHGRTTEYKNATKTRRTAKQTTIEQLFYVKFKSIIIY